MGIEESVRWGARREKKNNCEKKKYDHDSYHCCWWFGINIPCRQHTVCFTRKQHITEVFFS